MSTFKNKTTKSKSVTTPENKHKELISSMTFEEAVVYLKKLGEHETIRNCERDTALKWAIFLKNKGVEK